MKQCSRCSTEKPFSEFHRWARGKDGLKPYCKTCNVSAALAYAKANAASVAARQAEWSAKNLDKRRQNVARWVQRNPERSKHLNVAKSARFRASEKYSAWAAQNAGRITAVKSKYKVKRKSSEEAATPAWVDEDQIRLLYIYAAALGLHVDHIVPIVSKKVCGLHWHGNMQLLPARENIVKGNRVWPDMP